MTLLALDGWMDGWMIYVRTYERIDGVNKGTYV